MTNNMGAIIAEVQRLQQGLMNKTLEISEGDGAVKIVMNGYQEVLDVKIRPSVLSADNADVLQSMVARAVNRGITESKLMIKAELAKLTGGLNMPNLTGLF